MTRPQQHCRLRWVTCQSCNEQGKRAGVPRSRIGSTSWRLNAQGRGGGGCRLIEGWSEGVQAQVRDLQAAGCTKIFQEQVSSIAERCELQRALDYVRAGDTLVVTKVDRLARSTVGLWEIVKRLEAVEDGGVGLRVLNLGGETVDTKSATGKLILTIFAGFAQFEREMMLERQREGIAKAKAENRYMGRRPSARLKADEAVKLFNAGRSVTDVAATLNIGRGSVYRALEAAGMKSASGWT